MREKGATIRIVGQMLVRNEADVIGEIVGEIFRWIDDLVVLDGASDDGTLEILGELVPFYGLRNKGLHVTSRPDSDTNLNVLRTELQALTAEFSPDWVVSVDGDEIYQTDPVMAIQVAEEAGANVVRCHVPQFWLTLDDLRRGALHESGETSIQARRRWYSWGHMGTFIWKWNPDHYYPEKPSKRTPELPGKTWREWQIAGPVVLVCKHYCIRTLEQGLARAKERLARGGRWQFGKYDQNWLIDEKIAELHYLDPDLPQWKVRNNHDRLCDYMAGKHLVHR